MYVLVCLGYVGSAGIHVCISGSRVCWLWGKNSTEIPG